MTNLVKGGCAAVMRSATIAHSGPDPWPLSWRIRAGFAKFMYAVAPIAIISISLEGLILHGITEEERPRVLYNGCPPITNFGNVISIHEVSLQPVYVYLFSPYYNWGLEDGKSMFFYLHIR